MTQQEFDKLRLYKLLNDAKGREQAALDAYTHARLVQDLPAQARALNELDRAHNDVQILHSQLERMEEGTL